ncbi:ATP-binding cassette domain-containing protein, partial [Aeromonas salmonicida]
MLEISRLSLFLGQQTLLRDLSLTLHPGQVHVIIGPNGTGKTSLLR